MPCQRLDKGQNEDHQNFALHREKGVRDTRPSLVRTQALLILDPTVDKSRAQPPLSGMEIIMYCVYIRYRYRI
jgi:hypothetical protein